MQRNSCALNFFDTVLREPLSKNSGFGRTVLFILWDFYIILWIKQKNKQILCFTQGFYSICIQDTRTSF